MSNVVTSFIVNIIKILFQLFQTVIDIIFPRSSENADVELLEISTKIIDLICIKQHKCIERRLEVKETIEQIFLKNVYPLTLSQKNLVDSVKPLIPTMRLDDKKNDYCVLEFEGSFERLPSSINGDFFQDKEVIDAFKGLKTSFEQFVSAQKAIKSILVEIEEMLDLISSQQAPFEAPL